MSEFIVLRETEPPTLTGRTLTARIATYGRVYEPTPQLRERVARGAFKGPLARPSGVLRYRHAGERPGDQDDLASVHGLVVALREDGDAVIADLEVFHGSDGDKIIRLADSGAITGVSMAAVVAESTKGRDGITDIRRISQLHGVSLTPSPAYDDAQVLAIREQSTRADREKAAGIAAARAELDTVRRMLDRLR